MKKKGFTLVELIGVIAVLALVLSITIPSVQRIVETSYQKAYNLDLEIMEEVAKSYMHKKNIQIEEESFAIISIDDMLKENLLDEIYDPKSKNECEGYVVVKRINKKYVCFPFLKCDDNFVSSGYGEIDTTKPVITILGDNPANILVGDFYTDEGATASDDTEGDLTTQIIVSSNVDTNIPGVYKVTYTVSDKLYNTAVAERTVNVIDDVLPTIAFVVNGNNTYAKSHGTIVTVSDNVEVSTSSLKYQWTTSTTAPSEGDFITTFTNGGTIISQAGVTGEYYLWILAKDTSGNTKIQRTEVFNLDNSIPTITFNPNTSTATINDVSVVVTPTEMGGSGVYRWRYRLSSNNGISYGAWQGVPTGFDPNETYLLAAGDNYRSYTGTYMNLSVDQNYIIEFDYVCASGSVKFNIDLYPDTLPEIYPVATTTLQHYKWDNIISSSNNMNNSRLRVFNDRVKPNPTDIYVSNLNLYPKGIHTILLNSSGNWKIQVEIADNAGNINTITSGTYVIDKVAPTVSFGTNGNNTYAKSRSTPVTASDNMSLDTSSLKYQWTTSTTAPTEASFNTIFTNGGTINTPAGATGSYYLWILAKDNAGNTTITKSNVFNLDNTIPVITMKGNSPTIVVQGGIYSDAGATATDNIDGTITSNITTTSTVNTSIIGTYTVTYNVSDSSGNKATAVARTVQVISSTYAFSYTGNYQTFTVPYTGSYQMELWGAGVSSSTSVGQNHFTNGGYVSGIITLNKGEVYYVYVGGNGTYGGYGGTSVGGWNGGGGGAAYSSTTWAAVQGNGATDIRLVSGSWDDMASLKSRIMVAGGGAGPFNRDHATIDILHTGYAGGLSGATGGVPTGQGYCTSGCTGGSGGTQTSGYAFGEGQDGIARAGGNGNGAGGGGYYGGMSGDNPSYIWLAAGGGGGSSFISGHNGCNAIDANGNHTGQANHYSGKVFSNTVMIDSGGYNWTNVRGSQVQMPKPNGSLYPTGEGHYGKGYAKITIIQ
jgi:prepilin-type N-terminal cleavage/methylation domain-containing protein